MEYGLLLKTCPTVHLHRKQSQSILCQVTFSYGLFLLSEVPRLGFTVQLRGRVGMLQKTELGILHKETSPHLQPCLAHTGGFLANCGLHVIVHVLVHMWNNEPSHNLGAGRTSSWSAVCWVGLTLSHYICLKFGNTSHHAGTQSKTIK